MREMGITMCMGGAEWCGSRASDSQLREPGFESCAAVLKTWASVLTLHCSSLLSCINEYLAIHSGGYVNEQLLRINCSIWLDAPQTSWDSVKNIGAMYQWDGATINHFRNICIQKCKFNM